MRTFTEESALEFINSLPWGPAAGTCRDHKKAVAFAAAGAKVVRYGSIIEEEGWGGNPGNNFFYDEATGDSCNAIGLGDPGRKRHLETLAATKSAVNEHGAQLWVSHSARTRFNAHEYYLSAQSLFANKCTDVFEGNVSCGNVLIGDGLRKPLACWDIPLLDEGVAAMREGAGTNPISLKIAPLVSERMIADQINICHKYDIDYLDIANCSPGVYMEKPDGTPAVDMVRGGLGGAAMPPIVSAMLMIAKPMVKSTRIKLIATGGIGCLKDRGAIAYRYLKLGADGFGFNTALTARNHDPKLIQEIIFGDDGIPGLIELLVKHGLPD